MRLALLQAFTHVVFLGSRQVSVRLVHGLEGAHPLAFEVGLPRARKIRVRRVPVVAEFTGYNNFEKA